MRLQCPDGRKPVIFAPALHERGHHDVPEVDTRRVPCAETAYPSRVLEGLADAISMIFWVIAPHQKGTMLSRDYGVVKDETESGEVPES